MDIVFNCPSVTVHVHVAAVHIHQPPGETAAKLDAIIASQGTIMAELDTLKTEVAETSTVMASAVVLLKGLKEKLDEAIASGDPAALKALSDELDTNTNALASAISENTPVDPDA